MKKKIILSVLFILIVIFINVSEVSAYHQFNFNISPRTNTPVVNATQTVLGTAINVIRTVAVGVSIIMLTSIAIKFMTESPEGRAFSMKTLGMYIFGVILVFGTVGILEVIRDFTKNNIQ